MTKPLSIGYMSIFSITTGGETISFYECELCSGIVRKSRIQDHTNWHGGIEKERAK